MVWSSSLYRIVEDSESRLVLKGGKLGLWLLTVFLLTNAFVLLYVGLFVMSRRQLFPVIAGSILGLFFALCGAAALVWTIRYKSSIEVDRTERVVRFLRGASKPATEIPFAEVASIEIEQQRRSGSRGRAIVEYRVFLLDTDDSEWLIDRSTDGAKMAALSGRLKVLTGVLQREAAVPTAQSVPGVALSGRARAEEPTTRASRRAEPEGALGSDPPPEGIAIESDGQATLYVWRTLPRSPFWAVFWGLLTLMFGGLTAFLVVGVVIEITRQPLQVTLAFAALGVLALAGMYWVWRHVKRRGTVSIGLVLAVLILANFVLDQRSFIKLAAIATVMGYLAALSAFVLLARCRLRVSPAGLDYEEQILGRPLGWRRHSLAASEVEGFKIKAAVRGGGGVEVRAAGKRSFALSIPQGGGAFSRRELEWLRERWLEDLQGPARGDRG